jgi:hypothetical protein
MAKFKNPTKIKLHEINHTTDRTVSYSQYSTWRSCQYQWYLNYAKGNYIFTPSIHTCFGTAIHNTLQSYLEMIFTVSNAQAERKDWVQHFKDTLTEEYKTQLKNNKNQHFSSPDELREFFEDGIEIIKSFKKDKSKWFGVRGWELVGIETPIIYPLEGKTNLYMKGFIDLIMFNHNTGKYFIYDFKTSTRGWTDKEKKDETKTQQILLYKKYFSDLYKVNQDDIEVEFIVLKRKLFESPDFVIPRIQGFKPAAGKIKMKKTLDSFNQFLDECFTQDGLFNYSKEYAMNVGQNCKWCPFSQNGMCNKGVEEKVNKFFK